MSILHDDKIFMARALQLAINGAGRTSPNPMVGAVIVNSKGEIIGEGWHRQYGGPHAEVNAVLDAKNRAEISGISHQQLLDEFKQSTIYVTLEPCAHFGKTPPCALLLKENELGRVVIGTRDPFPKVNGGGIRILVEAGRKVEVGCLEKECLWLNRRFFTAHTLKRPWILLKWAETSNRMIAEKKKSGEIHPIQISTPTTKVFMHRERAMVDAIMVGTNTIISDNPSLTLRDYPGRNPRPIILESDRIPSDRKILNSNPIFLSREISLEENMELLYREYSITSIMVEGGASLLKSFIKSGLYDEIRIEQSPITIQDGILAPEIPSNISLHERQKIDTNWISTYSRIIR